MTDKIQKVEEGKVIELDQVSEEIKSLIVEAEFNSRWTLLEAYHEAGTIINHLEGNKEKLVQDIAVRVGRGERTLWYAAKFAETYPDINQLPEGKNISWNKVIHKYLTASSDPEELKVEKLKLQRGSVVMMKPNTLEGYGNEQCVSSYIEELGEVYLFGCNVGFKSYDVQEIIENL